MGAPTPGQSLNNADICARIHVCRHLRSTTTPANEYLLRCTDRHPLGAQSGRSKVGHHTGGKQHTPGPPDRKESPSLADAQAKTKAGVTRSPRFKAILRDCAEISAGAPASTFQDNRASRRPASPNRQDTHTTHRNNKRVRPNDRPNPSCAAAHNVSNSPVMLGTRSHTRERTHN